MNSTAAPQSNDQPHLVRDNHEHNVILTDTNSSLNTEMPVCENGMQGLSEEQQKALKEYRER